MAASASAPRPEETRKDVKKQKIFIQRDYSEGISVRFQTKFPGELEGIIDRQSFEHTIDTLNRIYEEAEKTNGSTFCENVWGCLTSYLIFLCIETRYTKYLKRVAAFLEEQNETVWLPRGLHIVDPIEREEPSSPLTADLVHRCHNIGLKTVVDFLNLDTETLLQKLGASYKDISIIKKFLFARYMPKIKNAEDIYNEKIQSISILDTGCNEINNFLDGGIYTGEITEIYGLPRSGKTQFCFSVLANLVCETENTAIYIDTNGCFSARRVEQILKQKTTSHEVVEDALRRIQVIDIYDVYSLFDVLHNVKENLNRQEAFCSGLKLIVLDSITSLIGPITNNMKFELQGVTMTLAQHLKALCCNYALSIIACNNLVQGKDFAMKPALGRCWQFVPSVILNIQEQNEGIPNDVENNTRKLSITKSCRKVSYGSVNWSISGKGIICA